MKLAGCKSAVNPTSPFRPYHPPPHPPVIYSTDHSKAVASGWSYSVLLCVCVGGGGGWVFSMRRFVLCLTLCYFVLVFSVLLALRLARLGKRELILFFVRCFDLCLFGFVGLISLLVSEKGCGL